MWYVCTDWNESVIIINITIHTRIVVVAAAAVSFTNNYNIHVWVWTPPQVLDSVHVVANKTAENKKKKKLYVPNLNRARFPPPLLSLGPLYETPSENPLF